MCRWESRLSDPLLAWHPFMSMCVDIGRVFVSVSKWWTGVVEKHPIITQSSLFCVVSSLIVLREMPEHKVIPAFFRLMWMGCLCTKDNISFCHPNIFQVSVLKVFEFFCLLLL